MPCLPFAVVGVYTIQGAVASCEDNRGCSGTSTLGGWQRDGGVGVQTLARGWKLTRITAPEPCLKVELAYPENTVFTSVAWLCGDGCGDSLMWEVGGRGRGGHRYQFSAPLAGRSQ